MSPAPPRPARLLAGALAALLARASAPPYAQAVGLGPCADPAYAASSTLSFTAVPGALAQVSLTVNDGLRLCVTAVNATVARGGLQLAMTPCAAAGGALPPAQGFSLSGGGALQSALAGGLVGAPAAAPAGPWWLGQPVFLLPAGTGGSSWSVSPSGRLVHGASGLCLDAGPLPSAHGCLDPSVRALPFCDASLAGAARVADLLGRLSLQEKIGLTGSGPFSDTCDLTDAGVPRLDVPPMMWLVETNSMIASQCYGASCATAFPSALNLAASFNRSVWAAKGAVMGTEMRALNNLGWHRADTQAGTRIGLNGFGPDINQPRDPRNGRAGELAGEDPLTIGAYATEMLRGMQEDPLDPTTLKMAAGVKHYAGYSMETGRFTSTGGFSLFDMWDTYLPQYEAAFVDGRASGSMCSYISLAISRAGTGDVPFVPACANAYLLQTVVREFWGRPDAVHTSDCGAVSNMARPRAESVAGAGAAPEPYAANDTVAAADALNGGMDLNTETTLPQQLGAALALGLTTEAALDAAVSRSLSLRMRLGLLDPLESQPFAQRGNFGAAQVGAPAHLAAALDGAAQGLVLVKNAAGALPLKRGAKLAVLGPLAAADRALLGDYYADAVCPGGADDQKGGYACVPTIAAALGALTPVVTVPGCTISGNDSSWGAALAAAADADAVVLALGTDNSIGGEGTDLQAIGLPGVQSAFGLAVLAAARGKPVVLVVVSAFPTAFSALAAPVSATVLAYTPGFGAPALAAALFGANRWGRAVLSVYPEAYVDAVALSDFGMTPRQLPAANPGRTYRWYDGSAGDLLVRYGQGLTYSQVALACEGAFAGDDVLLACNVTSTAGPAGDQVLTVYHRASADVIARVAGAHPVPLSTLVAFERVTVPAGATVGVAVRVPAARALALTDASGASVLYPGLHWLDVWDGGANNVTVALEAPTRAALVVKRPPTPAAAAARVQ